MTAYQIAKFETSHDPDDVAARNVEIGGLLRRVSGTYDTAEVVLHSSNVDTDLTITAIAYDPASQKISWRQTGGTRTNKALDGDGVTLRSGYRIVVTVHLTDSRHYDQSFWQDIADH